MAMKKENIDLKSKNIIFTMHNEKYKALRFYHAKMTLDIISTSSEKEGIKNVPFAHIPKQIKKIIKPN
jgi:hypothetical protein